MKKLLIMLMVVAMASFLFVGCLPVTPPIDPVDPVDPDPVLPPSVTPVIEKITNVDGESIINLYSSATQYMNKAEVKNGILVKGFALKYSEVKVYVRGVVVGTSTTYGVLERFTVFVAKASLGDDGAKTLYATATEVASAESTPSTVYAFTLDTVAPDLVSVTAEMDMEDYPEGIVAVTFSEELDADTAEDEDDWTVKLWGDVIPIGDVELVSPKVVELEADFGWGSWEADLIRVAYEDVGDDPITDLAGNPAEESYEYCYLEIEGEVPDYEPMELIYDELEFTAGDITLFEIDIVANDDVGKMVRAYLTLPAGLLVDGGTADFLYIHEGVEYPKPLEGGVRTQIGELNGSPLINQTLYFRVEFFKVGIYEAKVELETYYPAHPDWDEDDCTLYEDSILVKVVGN